MAMNCLDFFSAKLRFSPIETTESKLALFFERLFFMWISAFAALTFLFSILLSVLQIISLVQLFYVYGAITLVTLVLASLLYVSRQI